nr:unnamed protein product [Digitaria exilis]
MSNARSLGCAPSGDASPNGRPTRPRRAQLRCCELKSWRVELCCAAPPWLPVKLRSPLYGATCSACVMLRAACVFRQAAVRARCTVVASPEAGMCSYSSMDGLRYCKIHFEQLFKGIGAFSKSFRTCTKANNEQVLIPQQAIICVLWKWNPRQMCSLQEDSVPIGEGFLLIMGENKWMGKRWEDMDTDVLVKIFKELNLVELSPVSQTRASPYIWVDDRSDKRLARILRVAMAISCGNFLPKLKVLSLRCSKVTMDALQCLLQSMEYLEILNISHCLLLVVAANGRKQVVHELDDQILGKASRLREFHYCESRSCITCQRMVVDEGIMRWYRYEDWFWRRDEVRSLDLQDYGKLFDAGCERLTSVE